MSRRDREKLTDVIKKWGYVFSPRAASFQEAYPTIAQLRVEVTEDQTLMGGSARRWTITESHFRHTVDCSNPLCYRGGVTIGWMIHDMAYSKETNREETKRCEGYEGSPQGKETLPQLPSFVSYQGTC